MNDPHNSDGASARGQPEGRLDSWKKIASYLKRDVTTVQRWERRERMPVHRHLHDRLGSVFAFRSELDAWWEGRRARLTADSPAAAADASRTQPVRVRRIRLALVAGGSALALLAVALAWLAADRDYFWRSPLANARFTRLLDFGGTAQAAAISRDGKLVAFLADRDGPTDVWAGEVATGSYRNLTYGGVPDMANPSVRTVSFSPDSSLVAIWSRRSDGSQSGDVNILGIAPTGGPPQPYLRGAAEFDWSHDGRRLVYHTTAPGDPLFVRDAGAAAAQPDRRIYVAPAGVHCHFPLWSPDEAFIYFVRGVPPDAWDIWRVRPSGADLERITSHNARVAYPVMLDRRTLLYVATDADGSGPWLYAVDVERRLARRISSGLESYTSLAASADGARLVATIANTRNSLWRLPLGGEPAAAASSGPSLISANGVTPRLGGDSLFYLSWRGERQGIWRLAHGSAREIWSSARGRIVGGPAVAPDGRSLAFTVADGDRTVLYALDADGARPRVLSDSLALRGNPAWAPDGQSVVSAVVRDNEPRLTRIFLNGEAPLPLVAEYSLDPVWSPDGRFVVYSGADVGTTFPLRAAAADGRPYPLPSVMLTRGARRVVFWQNSQTLVMLRGEIGHKDFWLLDLRSGAERKLADVPPDFIIRDFDVAPSGAEVVLDRVQVSSDLALIERGR